MFTSRWLVSTTGSIIRPPTFNGFSKEGNGDDNGAKGALLVLPLVTLGNPDSDVIVKQIL